MMRRRLAVAVAEVPQLASRSTAVEAVISAAEAAEWPRLQRVHGDYHLGQVVAVPDRGWVLLDFEGEPLRPLAERSRPDLALRDIAGMLRSFDYAAGSWEHAHPGQKARDWAAGAQHAFLEGYVAGSGRDPREDAALLIAFQLDKALYEVVYEARNRPTWLTIPTDTPDRSDTCVSESPLFFRRFLIVAPSGRWLWASLRRNEPTSASPSGCAA
jgi:predicted trehalose synthase